MQLLQQQQTLHLTMRLTQQDNPVPTGTVGEGILVAAAFLLIGIVVAVCFYMERRK